MAGRSAPNSKRLTEPALPCFCSSCADPSLLPNRGGKWKGKIVNITESSDGFFLLLKELLQRNFLQWGETFLREKERKAATKTRKALKGQSKQTKTYAVSKTD